ncbi:CoA transferase [Nonomuraea sp. K274]|uniref:CoA transferase n=1 Tax=Nonomuraea cypriaca TaxID=1187855 RepID=A0A931EUW8_9ACTN|nr:CoA transferase [Nonomuraea cypriaca]MBF8185014.1 CoA transferase [Nonomuraea cypriaca]
MTSDHCRTREFLAQIWAALDGHAGDLDRVTVTGDSALRSAFAVTDLAAAGFGAAGLALSRLVATEGGTPPTVRVDRTLSSGWFDLPVGPSLPLTPQPSRPLSTTHPWMTEFRTADDRWLRVQGLFPRLRARIAGALGVAEDPEAVAAKVAGHDADEIEQVLVDGGAAVAASRSLAEWRAHPQARAVAAEPLVAVEPGGESPESWRPTPGRPLAGIRVLDLTRVVAGPMGTRFLAACGAEVLRLDAPDADETTWRGGGTDVGLGKRWAVLDLRTAEGWRRFLDLLAGADVLVHGYRPGAIDGLVPPDVRAAVRPGLVEVALNAYGWTGPWRDRRGFDTLVQFSTGLADETTSWALEDPGTRTPINALGRLVPPDRPRHLPVEALDFATGYQVAAAAINGLTRRLTTGLGSVSRLSLARTAALLADAGRPAEEPPIDLPLLGPTEDRVYATPHGPVRRLRFPVEIDGNPLFWERPYEAVGSSTPQWSATPPA